MSGLMKEAFSFYEWSAIPPFPRNLKGKWVLIWRGSWFIDRRLSVVPIDPSITSYLRPRILNSVEIIFNSEHRAATLPVPSEDPPVAFDRQWDDVYISSGMFYGPFRKKSSTVATFFIYRSLSKLIELFRYSENPIRVKSSAHRVR